MDELIRFTHEIPQHEGTRRFFLVLVRLVAVISLSPVFGGEAIPRRLRLGLAILLALVIAPAVGATPTPSGAPTTQHFGALVAKEAFIGLLFAVFLRLAFELLAATGALMDMARGASMAMTLDPLNRQQNSVLATFMLQTMLVTFLVSGGHETLIRALTASFATAPPDAALPTALADVHELRSILGLAGSLFLLAFRVAAPVVAVMFLVDLALALLARAAPQIQVYFLGLIIKGTLGIAVLVLTLVPTLFLMTGRAFDIVELWIGGR